MNSTLKGKIIYNWVHRNLPPLTWNIMAVKIGESFLRNGVDPFDINNQDYFDEDLVNSINFFLKCYYNKEIPDALLSDNMS